MDTLEVPLRTGFFQNSNFSELNDDSELLDSPPGNSAKKVRFQSSKHDDETNDSGKYLNHEDDPLQGKKNVEDLLEYANQVNDYVAQNLDKINSFRSDLLNDGSYVKPYSDVATQATNLSASMSNFELSDNEYDDHDTSTDMLSTGLVNDGSSALNKSEKVLLETLPSTEISEIIDYGTDNDQISESSDSTLENSPISRPCDTMPIQLNKDIKNPIFNSSEKVQPQTSQQPDKDNPKTSLIIADIKSSSDVPELSPVEGINILEDTIKCILQLSQNDIDKKKINDSCSSNDPTFNDDDPYDPNEYSNFFMKSAPTITYQQLISRIQAKCMFGSVVYTTATFLLQTLLLTREGIEGPIILRQILNENEIHRLIIASVRIATKLLEDCVHSHQYFCKVCGVSKRLLTRLEASLITCLKDDALIITSEKLAASIKVKDELIQTNFSH
ncbi:hypothetical protein HG535_0B01050 [Zygotorulaspora mrakii]|uniref:Uncharacterized protein n=1 Tax=Zygotorulaspora mrakii TaxID=42260 RepID=A0A7H9AY27_ZYGMR|nr:uncharacterized protein HG535_0B01050 [Zygotorulaspora mrakii]QLG71067.1 hypothetical protein HG535_0B01050 [Zygotorulaspora mrakii]